MGIVGVPRDDIAVMAPLVCLELSKDNFISSVCLWQMNPEQLSWDQSEKKTNPSVLGGTPS